MQDKNKKNVKKNINIKDKNSSKKKKKAIKETRTQVRKGLSRFYKIGSMVFLLFLVLIMLINIIGGDKKVSEEENRSLAQKPRFSFSRFFSGEYASEYNKYISDQFKGRKMWVKIKGNFDLLSGKKEINGVLIGKNGNLIEKFDKTPNHITDMKVNAINKFQSEFPKMKVNVAIVPTASEINKNLLPKNAPVKSEVDYIDYVKGKLSKGIKFIDVTDTMRKNNARELYYKTDHHWTSLGAYVAYKEIAKQMDLNSGSESDYNQKLATKDFYGSLNSKVAGVRGKKDNIYIFVPAKAIDVVVKYEGERKKVPSLYDVKSLEKKDKYEVFTGGNHALLKIKSDGAKNRKLLLIKDSYANSLLPFLVQNYSEIDVVDLRYFSGDLKKLIRDNDINETLILYNVNTFDEDSSILNLE